jgi:Spy/CpxP family protein refolding chaperone
MTTRTLYALTLGVVLLGSPCLKAEPKDEGQGPQAGSPFFAEERGFGGGFRVEALKGELKLSDAQMDKIREANKANRTALAPLFSQMQNDRDDLKALVEKKAKDEALSKALDKLKQDGEALRQAQAEHHEALAAILTPQQQAKFVLSMGQGRHGHWAKGKHGRSKACKDGKGPKPGDDKAQPAPEPEDK